jgi:hypothetical protein
LRGMDWDERVWLALKDAVSVMPPFVRARALRRIVECAEKHAQTEGKSQVQEEHLICAVEETVPAQIKSICKEVLLEQGIGKDVW